MQFFSSLFLVADVIGLRIRIGVPSFLTVTLLHGPGPEPSVDPAAATLHHPPWQCGPWQRGLRCPWTKMGFLIRRLPQFRSLKLQTPEIVKTKQNKTTLMQISVAFSSVVCGHVIISSFIHISG